MHSSNITRGGLTRDGKILVTASRDNTIKLWNTEQLAKDPERALINTIYVPVPESLIDTPEIPIVWGIDISPDGRWIVASARTDASGTFKLYLFNALSGHLKTVIHRNPGWIADVEYSDDGEFLAIGAYGDDGNEANGLWVWRTTDWSLVMHDSNYGPDPDNGGRPNGIDFGPSNSIVTTSWDGKVRFYSNINTAVPSQVWQHPRGVEPYDVEFSPSGDQIAIGYFADLEGDDPGAMLIHEANNLDSYRALDISGLDDGTGGEVTATRARGLGWSNDGRFVFANIVEHAYGSQDEVVRRWNVGEEFRPENDYPVCTGQTVIEVVPYAESGAIFLNSIACLSVVGNDGRLLSRLKQENVPVDLEPLPEVDPGLLLLSDDGTSVWGAGKNPGRAFSFNLRSREYKTWENTDVTPPAGMDGYVSQSPTITLENWNNSQNPIVNGVRVSEENPAFKTNDWAWSADISPEGDFIALGSSYSLQKLNPSGKILWQRPSGSLALRTNITPDGRFIVSLYEDGLIKWHDARAGANGEPILTLYLHPDGQRWALWTQDGYYDASPGATDLFGWQLSLGDESAAAWFEAHRYADQFYDKTKAKITAVIAEISGSDGQTRQASLPAQHGHSDAVIWESAPPITTVESTDILRDGTIRSLALKFRINPISAKPISSYRILLDNSTAKYETALDAQLTNAEFQSEVSLRGGSRFVRIQGETADGWGPPAWIDLHTLVGFGPNQRSTPLISRATAEVAADAPVLHAFLIGVNEYNNYADGLDDLCCAKNDVDQFASFLSQQTMSGIYKNVVINKMPDDLASKESIEDMLSSLRSIDAKDVVLVYFAGHGLSDKQTGDYYFVPHGAIPTWETLHRTTVSGTFIMKAMTRTPATALLFLDTCHSEGVLINELYKELETLDKAIITFSASETGESALEYPSTGHGAFTEAILSAPSSRFISDISNDGVIGSNELGIHVQKFVKDRTGGRQSSTWLGWGRTGVTSIDVFGIPEE